MCFLFSFPAPGAAFNCLVNDSKQVLVPTWLGQKLKSPGLHRTHAHWNVTVTRHENDWDGRSATAKLSLKFQTAYSWHSYIKQQAAGSLRRLAGQKLLCRSKGLYSQSRRTQQIAQAFSNQRFVIDYTDKRVMLIHGQPPRESQVSRE